MRFASFYDQRINNYNAVGVIMPDLNDGETVILYLPGGDKIEAPSKTVSWFDSLREAEDDSRRKNLTSSGSGTVSPMVLGAFWIVPAVWLLMHFAVLQVVASLAGR